MSKIVLDYESETMGKVKVTILAEGVVGLDEYVEHFNAFCNAIGFSRDHFKKYFLEHLEEINNEGHQTY